MPGMRPAARSDARPAAAAPQMDHANMPEMRPGSGFRAAAAQPEMDHANIPGMASSAAQKSAGQSQPAAMDHAAMDMTAAAAAPLDDVAMEKLRALVAELVRDPTVVARIQSDSMLTRLWQDPAVRTVLLKRP